MDWLFRVYAFIFGSMIGSFLNVVIYRLPLHRSLVTPRSSCPSCGTMIKWYQNIPIVSFLVLRAKCGFCGFPISWKYPMVELLMGLIAVLLFPETLSSYTLFEYAFYFSIACIFVSHFFIDLAHKLLLDSLNIYLALLILPYTIMFHTPFYWGVGALIGFGVPFAVTWGFYKIRGTIGLGGGDIKIWGILGLLLGPQGIVHNIFLSCFLGSLVGVAMIATKKMTRETALPFGPFIIIVASLQIYFPSFMSYLSTLLF